MSPSLYPITLLLHGRRETGNAIKRLKNARHCAEQESGPSLAVWLLAKRRMSTHFGFLIRAANILD